MLQAQIKPLQGSFSPEQITKIEVKFNEFQQKVNPTKSMTTPNIMIKAVMDLK